MNISSNVIKIFDFTIELKNFINYCFDGLFPLLLGLFVITIYFFYLDWKIGLIVLVMLFILIFVSKHFIMNAIIISEQREKSYIHLFYGYHEKLENLLNIYLNGEIETELEKSGKINEDHRDFFERSMKEINKMTVVFSVISLVIFGLVITKSYFNLKSGKFSGKKFITVTLIIIYLLSFLMQIVTRSQDEIVRLGVLKNEIGFVDELLNFKDKEYRNNNFVIGDIEFKNVGFKYDESEKWICRNLSFHIKKGQKVSIVGSSGMGKSTLMLMLLGLIEPNEGGIYLNNISVRDINPRKLRKRCCFINQDTALFKDSVLNNMKYGNDADYRKIVDLLKKYDILKHFDKLKNGLQTDVGYHGRNLSGGMQKIVTNMRALLKDSDIYIFDEPLTALDQECRKNMIQLIQDVTKGKTLIIITHDKEIFKITDKIIYLDELINKS